MSYTRVVESRPYDTYFDPVYHSSDHGAVEAGNTYMGVRHLLGRFLPSRNETRLSLALRLPTRLLAGQHDTSTSGDPSCRTSMQWLLKCTSGLVLT